MHYIVYLSTSTKLFTNDELMQLLYKCRINNAKAGVTGMLMYNQGTFFQSIEGEKKVIEDLFQRVMGDPRHHNIIRLKSGEIAERNFPGWAMGFTSSTTNDFSPITDFVNPPIAEIPDSYTLFNPAINLLQSFALTNQLDHRPQY